MKTCKYCRTQIDKRAKICPQCGRKQTHVVRTIISVIFVMFALIFLLAILSDDEPTASNGTSNPYEISQMLVEGEDLTATFLKAYEEDYIEGMLYFMLEIENNFDQQVWISCQDAVINGYSTTVMSGIPLEVNASSKGRGAFFVNESNINLENFEDLEEMKFKIVVYSSDTLDELYSSEEVCISFK